MHPTILMPIDPERMCIIVGQDISEDELQRLRAKFTKHKIISCCTNHAPSEGIVFAPIEMLSNTPPCAIILTPDDDWIIPSN